MRTVGIIGGMGPAATLLLFEQIIKWTAACFDQEHIPLMIDNNTTIPDRTAFLLGRGADPSEQIIRSARRLESMGADFLIMPCNTAHHFHARIAGSVNIPFLHMPREAASFIQECYGASKVGLLATSGTYYAGVYEEAGATFGQAILIPPPAERDEINALIYRIKAGETSGSNLMARVGSGLEKRGAAVIILGCTELSVACKYSKLPFIFVDPLLVLARKTVIEAGGRLKGGG